MDTYRAVLKSAENFATRVCRRPCPRCNLETIVRRRQLSAVASGLHVICYQCQLDWCFICGASWHPGDTCNETCYSSWSNEEGKEHHGSKILGDSIDNYECNKVRTVSESFNYQDLQEIPKRHSKESRTNISDQYIPSLSAKYISRVEDKSSVILNIENTCDICFANSTYEIRPCCQFPICGDCIRTYLTLKITNGVIDITCPNLGCNHVISEADISRSVDGKTFLKYQQFVVNAKQEPDKKTCPRCNYITVIDTSNASTDGLRISCPECELDWCFNCRAPWHQNMTCSVFQSRDDNVFKEWASGYSSGQINSRKCPTCQVYIQRNGGCDHMKCTQCGTDFCYQCGEKGFNHGHAETRNANNPPRPEQPLSVGARIRRCLLILGYIVAIVLIYLVFTFIIVGIPVLVLSRTSSGNDARSSNGSELPRPYSHSKFSVS